MVGVISHYISFNSTDMVPLFKTLIRPALEYEIGNVWCPTIKKHVLIENVLQRCFTKRIIGMKNLKRLKSLNLPCLEFTADKRGHDRDLQDYRYMDSYDLSCSVVLLFSH